ncbi:hypothetical protein HMPREF2625_10280 [Rothia sp. HMSC064D08]|nr:hypothetical protein HMPREF2625_10280 [Rothia sp. HMSC064D08]
MAVVIFSGGPHSRIIWRVLGDPFYLSYTGKRFVRFLWVMFLYLFYRWYNYCFSAELMNTTKMYFIKIKKPTTFTLEMD